MGTRRTSPTVAEEGRDGPRARVAIEKGRERRRGSGNRKSFGTLGGNRET